MSESPTPRVVDYAAPGHGRRPPSGGALVVGMLCIGIGVVLAGYGLAISAVCLSDDSLDATVVAFTSLFVSVGAAFCVVGFAIQRSKPAR